MTSQDVERDRPAWTSPLQGLARGEYVDIAISMLSHIGIAGIAAAVAIRMFALELLPDGCSTTVVVYDAAPGGLSVCAQYIQTVNHYITWTMYPGAVLLIAAAVVQWRWQDA